MKKRTIALIVGSALAACAVGRLTWIQATSVTLEESASSPDGKLLAKISSTWRGRFWGGTPVEAHDLRVVSKEGQLVRRVATEEPWTSWPKDSVLKWETDCASLSVTYKDHEALSTQLSIKALR